MKYIRTKDGRIIEESKLEPGFKEYIITLRNKKNNKIIDTLRMDYISDTKKQGFIEDIAFANYCKAHKLDVRDINRDKELKCNNILKSADTIEKLCDVLVCVDKTTKYHTILNLVNKSELYLEDYDWYGAIWTDKGLIYVAKMNERGELELI